MTFEEANKELDQILAKLESGEVGLVEGSELFKRGSELLEICYKEFNTAKGKISILREKVDKLVEDDI